MAWFTSVSLWRNSKFVLADALDVLFLLIRFDSRDTYRHPRLGSHSQQYANGAYSQVLRSGLGESRKFDLGGLKYIKRNVNRHAHPLEHRQFSEPSFGRSVKMGCHCE